MPSKNTKQKKHLMSAACPDHGAALHCMIFSDFRNCPTCSVLCHFPCCTPVPPRSHAYTMLYIIGLGLGDEKDITVAGMEAVKASDRLFLEHYTSVLGADAELLVRSWVLLHPQHPGRVVHHLVRAHQLVS